MYFSKTDSDKARVWTKQKQTKRLEMRLEGSCGVGKPPLIPRAKAPGCQASDRSGGAEDELARASLKSRASRRLTEKMRGRRREVRKRYLSRTACKQGGEDVFVVSVLSVALSDKDTDSLRKAPNMLDNGRSIRLVKMYVEGPRRCRKEMKKLGNALAPEDAEGAIGLGCVGAGRFWIE